MKVALAETELFAGVDEGELVALLQGVRAISRHYPAGGADFGRGGSGLLFWAAAVGAGPGGEGGRPGAVGHPGAAKTGGRDRHPPGGQAGKAEPGDGASH